MRAAQDNLHSMRLTPRGDFRSIRLKGKEMRP
jgi:hypothetical protein